MTTGMPARHGTAEEDQLTLDGLVLGLDAPDIRHITVKHETTASGMADAYGRLTVTGDSSPYRVTGELRLADDTPVEVSGSMNLYTGSGA